MYQRPTARPIADRQFEIEFPDAGVEALRFLPSNPDAVE
jgi:hypothetical protein